MNSEDSLPRGAVPPPSSDAIEIEIEPSGREFATSLRAQAELLLGKRVRILALCFFVPLLAVMVFGVGIERMARDSVGGLIPLGICALLLIDLLGLRFVRYRITGARAARKRSRAWVQIDPRGVRWGVVDRPERHVGLGWGFLGVLSAPEGILIYHHPKRVAAVYLPSRFLDDYARAMILEFARRADRPVIYRRGDSSGAASAPLSETESRAPDGSSTTRP